MSISSRGGGLKTPPSKSGIVIENMDIFFECELALLVALQKEIIWKGAEVGDAVS